MLVHICTHVGTHACTHVCTYVGTRAYTHLVAHLGGMDLHVHRVHFALGALEVVQMQHLHWLEA